jgi:hypothetical protein
LFKSLLFDLLDEQETPLRLTPEELKRVADYAKSSFFKHLRLYDFVLNNKQLNEVKRLTLNVNAPIIAQSLNEALLIAQEEALSYEDDQAVIKNEVDQRKEQVRRENRLREEEENRRAQGIDVQEDPTLKDEDIKGITDERLRKANIDKETKVVINNTMNHFEGTLTRTMEERARALDEKAGGAGAGASAAKKK